ncbi:MAG: hypothetical protein A3C47_05330 [Omnitrophica bacterium RIFCSPHIGHO2_02_FULL_51_18]|nr:MAG: hypothetical protein A3C47_05330 [Omnitrophica bacterium RIFCSPHIGHO2_02_FULL_51_18]
MNSGKDHFLFLKKLVALEEDEELEEIKNEFTKLSPKERELRGKALLGLALKERYFSPAEHILASFVKKDKKPFPLFSLEVGDIVTLFPEKETAKKSRGDYPAGTVYEKTSCALTVAFNKALPDWVDETPAFQLHKSINQVTYKRMFEALDAVIQTRNTRLALFRDISLREKNASFDTHPEEKIVWLDAGLNASQKEAVRKSMLAKDIFLLHGPPGTGKTTALIEIIRQSVAKKEWVFVTAPSNTACDNILEKLVFCGVRAVRLGHPARISESLREHTLDFKLALHPLGTVISDIQGELERFFKKEERYRDRRSPGREAEREVRDEIMRLKGEIKNLKKDIFKNVMKEAEVFVGTLASIGDRSLEEQMFDLLVIDEATQATEPMTWIPMTRTKKVVMAGDHFQLPPTVRSKEAEEKGLGVTLFERFYDILCEESKQLLERQYRMNEIIMGFSSREFYKNLLVADDSVKTQTLSGLSGVETCDETKEPLLFLDTAGKGFEEKLEEGSESRYNIEEAGLLLSQLKKMLELGVPPGEIAVISPYSAQVRFLTSKSPDPKVEIDSVDGFQGREKELVIVSLVRSNMEGELGFLADTRRMNVAMTRARRKLIVIGDSATLSSIKFYADFMKYAEEVGGYKSAWEL